MSTIKSSEKHVRMKQCSYSEIKSTSFRPSSGIRMYFVCSTQSNSKPGSTFFRVTLDENISRQSFIIIKKSFKN